MLFTKAKLLENFIEVESIEIRKNSTRKMVFYMKITKDIETVASQNKYE